MKITALIPEELIDEVKRYSGGKNITESLIIALNEYINQKKIDYLIDSVQKEPLVLKEGFTAYSIRNVNRDR